MAFRYSSEIIVFTWISDRLSNAEAELLLNHGVRPVYFKQHAKILPLFLQCDSSEHPPYGQPASAPIGYLSGWLLSQILLELLLLPQNQSLAKMILQISSYIIPDL